MPQIEEGLLRLAVGPQHGGKPVTRDVAAQPQRQQRQQPLRLTGGKSGEWSAVNARFKRAKEPQFEQETLAFWIVLACRGHLPIVPSVLFLSGLPADRAALRPLLTGSGMLVLLVV